MSRLFEQQEASLKAAEDVVRLGFSIRSLPRSTRIKMRLARVAGASGLWSAGMAVQRLLGPYIRIAYYHDVPPARAQAFEQQLAYLSRHFVPATQADIEALLTGAAWPHDRPGIILTFDDGLRSQAEVAAPLLERYCFQGWFFAPIGLILTDKPAQPEAARKARVPHEHDVGKDPRVFMTLAQLRDLAGRHVVGCHTDSHRRLGPALTPDEVQTEIIEAREKLAEHLQRSVDSFAWVGGEETAYSSDAERAVARHFSYAFTTNSRAIRPGAARLQLHRTHLEAWFPPSLVDLQLSGLMDLYYASKRRRLRRTFAPIRGVEGGSGFLQIPG